MASIYGHLTIDVVQSLPHKSDGDWRIPEPDLRPKHRRGLTLTDLMIALCCFALVLALAVPYMQHALNESRRIVCANNLRQVGLGAIMYAQGPGVTGTYWSHVGLFPGAGYDKSNPTPTAYTGSGPGVMNPQGTGFIEPVPPPSPNDVTASLYLIYFTQDISSTPFVCPGTDATPFPFGNQPYRNFPSRQHLSYSYNNPFPSPSALHAGWKFDDTLGPDSPLAADMNPGLGALAVTPNSSGSQLRAANSANHNGIGQNVVYCDGHVEFQKTPYCGRLRASLGYRDNIYTYGVSASTGGLGVSGPPQDAEDAVLLPTMSDGPQPPNRPWSEKPETIITVAQIAEAAALLVIAIVTPFHLRRWFHKKRRA